MGRSVPNGRPRYPATALVPAIDSKAERVLQPKLDDRGRQSMTGVTPAPPGGKGDTDRPGQRPSTWHRPRTNDRPTGHSRVPTDGWRSRCPTMLGQKSPELHENRYRAMDLSASSCAYLPCVSMHNQHVYYFPGGPTFCVDNVRSGPISAPSGYRRIGRTPPPTDCPLFCSVPPRRRSP